MAVNFSPIFNSQVVDENGDPAVGWKIYTYVAGSSTPLATYTTSVGNVAQSNPIVIDALGFPTVGQIWLTEGSTYKLVLTDDADVVQKTEDNISGTNDFVATGSEWIASGLTPTYISATSFSFTGDQTSTLHVGRRIKTVNTGGTIYSTITASSFSSVTTVTVANDTGTLDSGLTSVSYSIISANNPSISPQEVYRKGASVASAGTCDIWSVVGDFIHITGNTGPITSFGTAPYAGAERTVIFDSTPTLTDNATSLQCPGGEDIVCAAGDRAVIRADTTANMIIAQYVRASRMAVTGYTLGSIQVFTSDDTWTKPAGCVAVVAMVQAGGGGGGGADSDGSGVGGGGGGGGGGYAEELITSGLGATETITVGVGGTAGSAAGGNGGTGGTTSFGSHVSATGGSGGTGTGAVAVTTSAFAGGDGGAGSGGSFNLTGGSGSAGIGITTHGVGGKGGDSHLGGGGRGAATSSTAAGTVGNTYGGGGGGGGDVANATGVLGGVGGAGVVIVYEYY